MLERAVIWTSMRLGRILEETRLGGLCEIKTGRRLVDAGEKRVVGVNAYQIEEERQIPLLRIDDSVEKKQVARTREVRRKRNPGKAQACIVALKEASRTPNVNLMPLLVDAAREYVTLGEMCDALRETMGVYTDPAMF